jgi:hypothetical protein
MRIRDMGCHIVFNNPVLLMGVGARKLMSNANLTKKRIMTLILPNPIQQDINYFVIEPTLNKGLKRKKILGNIRFVMN